MRLAYKLADMGYDVVLTRESGGTHLGKQLREMLLNPDNQLSKATELFLQMADRAQHYKEVLKPALRSGKIVISDRYFDSTLQYQGAGRGWKAALLWRLHHATTGSLLPDITFVLDGTSHREVPNDDRFEQEHEEFKGRIEQFMRLQATKDKRYALINANQSINEVSDEILRILDERKLLEMEKEPIE
jgi:dTMP kinase